MHQNNKLYTIHIIYKIEEEDTGQDSISNYLESISKKQVHFSIEEYDLESIKNSQSKVNNDMTDRMLLLTIKLEAKQQCKDNKKCIEEGLEKTVTLVQ